MEELVDLAAEAAKGVAGTLLETMKATPLEKLEVFLPFLGAKRKAVDYYIQSVENSNLDEMTKTVAIFNIKKVMKELRNQTSIVEIAQKVAKPGTDFSSNSKVDDDWLNRFMDSAKFVSNEEMQTIWGNILASEFENPGENTLTLVRILSEITPYYAKVFANICKLGVRVITEDAVGQLIDEGRIIVLPVQRTTLPYLEKMDINHASLWELSSLGLITVDFSKELGIIFDEKDDIHLVHIYSEEQEVANLR